MSKEQKIEHNKKWSLYKRERLLMKNYGITVDQYNAMFSEQGGKCAICGKHQQDLRRALVVDHDHETGEIRGLLCDSCNTAIGFIHEDIDILEKAIQYLKPRKSECSMKLTS